MTFVILIQTKQLAYFVSTMFRLRCPNANKRIARETRIGLSAGITCQSLKAVYIYIYIVYIYKIVWLSIELKRKQHTRTG